MRRVLCVAFVFLVSCAAPGDEFDVSDDDDVFDDAVPDDDDAASDDDDTAASVACADPWEPAHES